MRKFLRRLWSIVTYFSAGSRARRAYKREAARQKAEMDTFVREVKDGLKPLINRYEAKRLKPAPANTAVLVADGPTATRFDAIQVLKESKVDYELPQNGIAASKALTAHDNKFLQRSIERPDRKQE
jgi:hypothetical protein